ncbi:MAG TPA: hypothetical protein PLA71_06330 [Saccharofermentans sp.]|nr:hypothetical protein [Saccharofermentans sp.]
MKEEFEYVYQSGNCYFIGIRKRKGKVSYIERWERLQYGDKIVCYTTIGIAIAVFKSHRNSRKLKMNDCINGYKQNFFVFNSNKFDIVTWLRNSEIESSLLFLSSEDFEAITTLLEYIRETNENE